MKGYSLLIGTLVGLMSIFAFASETQSPEDLLIDKLSRIQLNLAAKDPSKIPVSLRLADLYAERARQKSLKELNDGCTVCVTGKDDRAQALKFYLEVLDKVPMDQQGRVMLQVGHLYEMNGEEAKAIEFYQSILKKNTNKDTVLESYFSLAEIYFKKRQYATAHENYVKVAQSTASSRGRAAYRSAWCLFNMGQLDKASQEFETILSTPELLTKAVGSQVQVDEQFKEEVIRDWITVLAQKWNPQAPQKIHTLSPEKMKVALLVTLALELERVGKKTEALETWEYAFDNIADARIKLQAHTHKAVLYQDIELKKAVQNFESALSLWTSLPECQNSKSCDEEYKLLKHFIVGWNKKEKLNPSPDLVSAYQKYLNVFSQEAETHLWLAQLAEQMKNFSLAQAEYQKASLLLTADEKENAVLKQLEVAEMSKDGNSIVQAQDFYLTNSVKKTKEFEVRYQRLRQIYEQNQYALAFEGLKKLSLDPNGNLSLRKQAADLALDCLVLTHDDEKLQSTAMEFSQVFKGPDARDFNEIYQKTLLTQSAKLAEQGQTQLAFDTLLKFDSQNATLADRVILLKNKILLSQKLRRFDLSRPLIEELLAIKTLSPEDQGFAWAQKAYLAELFLDFKTAKSATEKIQVKTSAEEKTKNMKLALFGELLGEKDALQYEKLLKNTEDQSEKNQILVRIIQSSANPETAWTQNKVKFSHSSNEYARLALEIYAKKPSASLLKAVVTDQKLAQTPSGEVMRTYAWIQEFDLLKKKMVSHTLDIKKQVGLARSIKDRAKMIEQMETLAAQAIDRKDWTAQLLALQTLATESLRFYQDLLSAPLPSGLSSEEEQSYLTLLSSQAAPYQTKATDAAQKVQEFWMGEGWKKSLQTSWQDESLRYFMRNEIAHLQEIAPEENKLILTGITNQVYEKPTLAELEIARNKVRENPLSLENLNLLKDLEFKSQNKAMVQYLEIRVREIQ